MCFFLFSFFVSFQSFFEQYKAKANLHQQQIEGVMMKKQHDLVGGLRSDPDQTTAFVCVLSSWSNWVWPPPSSRELQHYFLKPQTGTT